MPTYMGTLTSQKRDFSFSGDGATGRCQSPDMGAKNGTLVCRSSRYFNNRVIAPEDAYFFLGGVSKFYFSHE